MRLLVAGAAGGGAGMLLFVAVHSLLIVPIWSRAAHGIPVAQLGGVGFAAAFEQAARTTGWRSAADGARFGAFMFATIAPATVFSNALRLAGVAANDWPGAVGSLAIAAASGAAAGVRLTRTRRGTIGFAAAATALVVAMAGPIPVVNSTRAAALFLGFLPICAGAGAALARARGVLAPEAT